MAPPKPKEFIETALLTGGPYALSYSDHEQKWLIQRHLLSFLQEYPSFTPSTECFTHDNGTQVNLLRASGSVHVSTSTPPVPLTVWLHENYPQQSPMVFVALLSATPIHSHHPFVDSTSGATSPPYILTWNYPPCNLCDLMHNLVHLFSHDHPFLYSPVQIPPAATPSITPCNFVSKKEALDRLVGMICYDMVELQARTLEEMEQMFILQDKLKKRDRFITRMIPEMERERESLKDRERKWAEEADRLVNWLKVNDGRSICEMDAGKVNIEDAFEVDEKVDSSAADLAIEDLLYKLDKALEVEVVSFDSYIRQVRSLAREQFFHRAALYKFIV